MSRSVKRGEIYYVTGNFGTGSEQSGERPAVIVSNDAANKYSPVIEVVYLTTKKKTDIPTHVYINSSKRPSIALCEQVASVSKSRLVNFMGSITVAEMRRIDKALQTSLGIHKKAAGGAAMQITMNTPYGEMNFDMPQDKALDIIQKAMLYAAGGTEAAAEKTPEPVTAAQEPEPPVRARAERQVHRRVDSLFGDFRTENPRKTEETPEEREYKGFLLVKCEECGKIKGFCAKVPTSEHRCECGHRTKLRDLKPVFLKCKCGNTYKYKTNITDERFEYPCLNCGSPVDLELNERRNTYVTITD